MKLYLDVFKNGRKYSIGDTIPAGKADFDIYCDVYARWQNYANILFSEIRIITNGGECIYNYQRKENVITLDLKPNHWYRLELWGLLDGKEMPLAVTSPIYTK